MYKVYYTDPVNNKSYSWDCKDLKESLSMTKRFRELGMSFVTMVSENPDCVSLSGVDSIEEGLCPDGTVYTWKKRRR